LGEIHPAAVTNGKETCIISCRALRSNAQYTAKRVSELRAKQDHLKKGARRWKKLQRRKNRFQAHQRRRARDLEHKVTRAVVNWVRERGVCTLVVGDVRDVADGKHLNTKNQQKVGIWSHGRQRAYLEYKAAAAGITVSLEDEHDTTKTCPGRKDDGTPCDHQYKPKGRIYRCPACGFVAHRDSVGCNNILSRRLYGAVGQVVPPSITKYRHPFLTGKRSRLDTAELAWEPTTKDA
jgi:putative transposase